MEMSEFALLLGALSTFATVVLGFIFNMYRTKKNSEVALDEAQDKVREQEINSLKQSCINWQKSHDALEARIKDIELAREEDKKLIIELKALVKHYKAESERKEQVILKLTKDKT